MSRTAVCTRSVRRPPGAAAKGVRIDFNLGIGIFFVCCIEYVSRFCLFD